MATLSITKGYSAGQVLTKAALDNIENAVETFLNTTKIGYENINIDTLFNALTQSQAETILTTGGYGTLITTTLGSDQALSATPTVYNSVAGVSAGTYLISAVALVQVSKTSFLSAPTTQAAAVNVYNVTSSTAITPIASIRTGFNTSAISLTLSSTSTQMTAHFVYTATLTSTSTIGFQAYLDSATTGGSATLKQNSVIQLYRLKGA